MLSQPSLENVAFILVRLDGERAQSFHWTRPHVEAAFNVRLLGLFRLVKTDTVVGLINSALSS